MMCTSSEQKYCGMGKAVAWGVPGHGRGLTAGHTRGPTRKFSAWFTTWVWFWGPHMAPLLLPLCTWTSMQMLASLLPSWASLLLAPAAPLAGHPPGSLPEPSFPSICLPVHALRSLKSLEAGCRALGPNLISDNAGLSASPTHPQGSACLPWLSLLVPTGRISGRQSSIRQILIEHLPGKVLCRRQ